MAWLIKSPFRSRISRSVLLLAAFAAGCASFAPRPVTPISAVTDAARAGESSELIVSKIRSAKTTYALRGSDFAKLAELGVQGPVLDELQQRFFSEVQLLAKSWFAEQKFGGPATFYPQPVDLDNLSRGGSGMADASGLGRITHTNRPPGVPEWVPPHPAPPTAKRVTVDEILAMTKGGDSPQQVAERIRASHIEPLYAESGPAIARTRTAAITGSLYARLAEQGVAHEVLDALQATYLSDHVEWSRQAYQDLKGSAPSFSR